MSSSGSRYFACELWKRAFKVIYETTCFSVQVVLSAGRSRCNGHAIHRIELHMMLASTLPHFHIKQVLGDGPPLSLPPPSPPSPWRSTPTVETPLLLAAPPPHGSSLLMHRSWALLIRLLIQVDSWPSITISLHQPKLGMNQQFVGIHQRFVFLRI